MRGHRSNSWDMSACPPHYVLLLGKIGHGKSTLGNRMLDLDRCFKINDLQCPQTTKGSAFLLSASQLKSYKAYIYDHDGFFEGASSINTLSSAVPSKLHLVIFVLKCGYRFDESKVKLIISEWQISEISVLVLTHCELLSEEERGLEIAQFKEDHSSVAELMGKGILAVEFPDSSYMENETELNDSVEADKSNLRQLIYSCDEPVSIPQSSPQNESKESPPSENRQPPQNENRQPQCPQNLRKCLYFGVSVCIGSLCILYAYIMLKS